MSGRAGNGHASRTARSEPSKEHQYLVKMMRPIFQRVVISVNARSDGDAARKARRLAPMIKS